MTSKRLRSCFIPDTQIPRSCFPRNNNFLRFIANFGGALRVHGSMGGTSSTLNFTNIKLTERECRTALRDLFDEAAFEDYADPDNMIALDALNAIYQGKTDVFLTHDWGSNRIHHERVAQINQEMKNRGLRTWFASDHPGEDIRKRSIAGMENSSCVVVCITRRYVDAVNTGDGTAGEGFAAEFRHAARTKGIAGIVVVVIDESMRDATQWTGELGMLLGGSPYIDLSSALPAPAPAERMDQLYAAILSVSKLTLGQVLSDSIWKDLVEKKVRSASTMVSSMLAAASVATTSLDPTDTPEPTQASNNASQMAARSLESELQAWMFQHTKIVPKYAERYVAALMDHGIGSQEKLKKKLWRNPHFLIDLGIDEDDAEEIAKALLGEGKEIKATHVDEREYKVTALSPAPFASLLRSPCCRICTAGTSMRARWVMQEESSWRARLPTPRTTIAR